MIYLASSSPRRAELLRQIGVKFEIIEVDIDETPRQGESIDEVVMRLSREKALAGRDKLADKHTEAMVLAADTLIGLDGAIIGKPDSELHCREIMLQLSGRRHLVYSGVALVRDNGQLDSKITRNEIRFRQLDRKEIVPYCEQDEPMDKAGAYAIQGRAAMFIEHLSGSYSAVMGLPLFETALLLRQAGYRL